MVDKVITTVGQQKWRDFEVVRRIRGNATLWKK